MIPLGRAYLRNAPEAALYGGTGPKVARIIVTRTDSSPEIIEQPPDLRVYSISGAVRNAIPDRDPVLYARTLNQPWALLGSNIVAVGGGQTLPTLRADPTVKTVQFVSVRKVMFPAQTVGFGSLVAGGDTVYVPMQSPDDGVPDDHTQPSGLRHEKHDLRADLVSNARVGKKVWAERGGCLAAWITAAGAALVSVSLGLEAVDSTRTFLPIPGSISLVAVAVGIAAVTTVAGALFWLGLRLLSNSTLGQAEHAVQGLARREGTVSGITAHVQSLIDQEIDPKAMIAAMCNPRDTPILSLARTPAFFFGPTLDEFPQP